MEIFIRYSTFLPAPMVSDEHHCSIWPSLHSILTLTAVPIFKIFKNIPHTFYKYEPFNENFMLDEQTILAHPSLLHLLSNTTKLAQHTKIVEPAMLVTSHSSSSESEYKSS